jgi:hypothetical protein
MNKKYISYCCTCKGRLWQLKETLSINLRELEADEEIVLVDYNSSDNLRDWVWGQFDADIAAGRLTFFEVLEEAPWHPSKAKNLAHRLAKGAYLFNLDADNFVLQDDRRLIRSVAEKGLCARQGTGKLDDGTPGRIGLPASAFHAIGGYDEGLLGVQAQDYDLILRLEAAGHRFVRLPPPQKMPISNSKDEKLAEYASSDLSVERLFDRVGRLNMAVIHLKLKAEGFKRFQNSSTFRGRLNSQPVFFDGTRAHPMVQRKP